MSSADSRPSIPAIAAVAATVVVLLWIAFVWGRSSPVDGGPHRRSAALADAGLTPIPPSVARPPTTTPTTTTTTTTVPPSTAGPADDTGGASATGRLVGCRRSSTGATVTVDVVQQTGPPTTFAVSVGLRDRSGAMGWGGADVSLSAGTTGRVDIDVASPRGSSGAACVLGSITAH